MTIFDQYPEAFPQTAREHATEAQRILIAAADDLSDAIMSTDPKRIESALASYPGKIATAQVHATLALVPEPARGSADNPITVIERDSSPVVGDRVIFVQPRPGRQSLILASEVIGTVTQLGRNDEARVIFDDDVDEWLAVRDLRVVLGA